MKDITLIKLYLIFVKIGAVLLGGGYVILPIITNELCDKRELIDKEEIINYFALSQSLPGIIAANISMFAGYRLRGKSGAVVSMLGIITVPFIVIICLASIIGLVLENPYVKGCLWGVGIAVTVLIILTAREVWQTSKRDVFFYVILILTLFGLLFFKLSPVRAIVVFSTFGLMCKVLAVKLGGNK